MSKPVTGEVLAAISNEMVRLKAQHYGKGPVEAKAYVNDNWLFAVLRGGFTRVEETLIAGGDEDLVRTVRLRFQLQTGDRFVDAVERITGRKVLNYQSAVMGDPDFVVEMFLLDDEGSLPEPGSDGEQIP